VKICQVNIRAPASADSDLRPIAESPQFPCDRLDCLKLIYFALKVKSAVAAAPAATVTFWV